MKKETHKLITRKAIDIYCSTRHTQLTSAMNESRLRSAAIKGSIDEDGKTFTRLVNWHFYPSNSVLKEQKKIDCLIFDDIITPTSERILTKRQGDFMDKLGNGASYRLFKVFGRILHHIQDMSTPSHVLPIYHAGGKSSDPYEEFLVEKSNRVFKAVFDDIGNFHSENSTGFTGDFVQLYHDAAGRLFNYLTPENTSFSYRLNETDQNGDSTLFWLPFDSDVNHIDSPCKIKGFGMFGKLGGCYGDSAPTKCSENTYKVDESVYVKLAAEMVSMAINDTIIALGIFEQMIKQHFNNGDFLLDDPDSFDD